MCKNKHAHGFTLVQLLVVMSIVGIVSMAVYPSIHKFVARSRMEAISMEAASLMHLARQEAVKSGEQVVVTPRFASRELLAFADRNANSVYDPGPSNTNGSAQARRRGDRKIASMTLPAGNHPSTGVYFLAPSPDEEHTIDATHSIVGFDQSGGQAVFLPDGSVMDDGAFRFGDLRGNFFEVRVWPRATGRVEIRKYKSEPPASLDPGFYARGEAGEWVWYDLEYRWSVGSISDPLLQPESQP